MRSYSEVSLFTDLEIRLWREARAVVHRLPDKDRYGDLLRCHEVARVVAILLGRAHDKKDGAPFPVVDGKYGSVDHSWIPMTGSVPVEASHGEARRILDPYAVGRLPAVQLVEVAAWMLPHGGAYKVLEPRTDIFEDVIDDLLELFKDGVAEAAMEF